MAQTTKEKTHIKNNIYESVGTKHMETNTRQITNCSAKQNSTQLSFYLIMTNGGFQQVMKLQNTNFVNV